MNDFIYFVVRVFYKKADMTKQHSVQEYTDLKEAKKRFYSILAGDVASVDVAYELVQIIRSDARCMESEVFDNREPVTPPESEASE